MCGTGSELNGFIGEHIGCREYSVLCMSLKTDHITPLMNSPPPLSGTETWPLRLAREEDIPALEELIPLSVRALQAAYYSAAQMEAALTGPGPVFGVDRQLIRDGTYFVAERDGGIVGCGGWSKRQSLFGGDSGREYADALLDSAKDAARVRAFFVHPKWARQGIGRSIMNACERAIIEAGFRSVVIVATLAGEPLYATFGYAVAERYEIEMTGGLMLPVVRMTKTMETSA
jgi:predicted N-acetyltransferase YhbS